MKRFLKTLAHLVISLFIVASGVDAALDHLSHSVSENSFTVYTEQGVVVLTYNGDLSFCKTYPKPGTYPLPSFLRRS